MNKIYTLVAALLCSVIVFSQTDLTNMDFEAWYENHYSSWFPNNFYWEPNTNGTWNIWETGNSASSTVNSFPTTRTEDAVSGSYAVRMETLNIFSQPAAGNIFTGHFIADMFDSQALFGVPFTGTPDAFRGYYKYTPGDISGAPDTCAIYAILSRWDGSQRVEIAKAELFEHGTVATYTYFDLPFTYNSTETPDTIAIVFSSSKHGDEFIAGIGSTLFIDDISLFYDLSDVSQTKEELEVKIFYNFDFNYIRIQRNSSEKANIDLYDITGKIVFSTSIYENFSEVTLPHLNSGVYICRYKDTNNQLVTKKLMIR